MTHHDRTAPATPRRTAAFIPLRLEVGKTVGKVPKFNTYPNLPADCAQKSGRSAPIEATEDEVSHQRRAVPRRFTTPAQAADVLRRAGYRKVGEEWMHKDEPTVRVVQVKVER